MRCVHHSTLQQAWYIRRSAVGSTNFSKNSLCLWRYLKTILKYKLTYMPGRNCAFFGCATSQKHGLSLFKIPSLCDDDGEHTVALKTKAREEWLRLILRTREMTPALKKRIEANNIFVCEVHFKPDCILTSKLQNVIIFAYIYFALDIYIL